MMDQITLFSPPICVKLIDGTLAKFARSTADHWAVLAEEIAAYGREDDYADIDATVGLSIEKRLSLRKSVRDAFVWIDHAIQRARLDPRWIKRHLTLAVLEAGGSAESAAKALAMIPMTVQASVADQIAMLPVVANVKVGTEENPLVAGVAFSVASTGPASAPSSPVVTPASDPAASPSDTSSN